MKRQLTTEIRQRVYHSIIERKCPVCGRIFIPAVYHAYRNSASQHDVPVCSYSCQLRSEEMRKKKGGGKNGKTEVK